MEPQNNNSTTHNDTEKSESSWNDFRDKMQTGNLGLVVRTIILLTIIAIAMNVIPDITTFNYKYEIGSTWNYPTLEAPISFPLYKSSEQLIREKKEISKNVKPFYIFDENLTNQQINNFRNAIRTVDKNSHHTSQIDNIISTFTDILNTGVIKLDDEITNKDSAYIICLEKGKYVSYSFLGQLYTTERAYSYIQSKAKNLPNDIALSIEKIILENLRENITLDKNKTDAIINERYKNLSETYGLVSRGSLIVTEDEIITYDTYNKLNSLKTYYENNHRKNDSINVRIANFLFFCIIILAFYLYLYIYEKNLLLNWQNFHLITIVIGVTVFLAVLLQWLNHKYVYIVPICIIPIILRAFYDNKVALWGLLLTTLLIAVVTSGGFNYIIVTIVTGIITIACISKIERRGQYFAIIFPIVISYVGLTILSEIVTTGKIIHLDTPVLLYYIINAGLTLTAMPLVFLIEKLSGKTTDISLIEYANTNNKLLRQFSEVAPGTFEHSIQVANLSERAARKIGANVLMVRTGALYHDIGKMSCPNYFTENQAKSSNPHDELNDPKKSADIIFKHVSDGVEMAKRNRIPKDIAGFISTHHGTRLHRFFYNKAVEMYGKENVNENDYRYPDNNKPNSRETAIVMMADSVQAASKSWDDIADTNAAIQRIKNTVNSIIDSQIAENQFINTNLTFKDINEIKATFIDYLIDIMHKRIRY